MLSKTPVELALEAIAVAKEKQTPYRLVTDLDGNWYIIKEDQIEEFSEWVGDVLVGYPTKYTSVFDFCRVLPGSIRFNDWWTV